MATIASTSSATGSVVAAPLAWWLKDPEYPALNMELEVQPPFPDAPAVETAVFAPLDRSRKVVLRGTIRGLEGALSFKAFSEDDWTAFLRLWEPGRTLLLQAESGGQWYVQLGQPRSLLVEAHGAEDTGVRHREVEVPFVEVDVP